jgi:hypothetical protein
MKSVDSRCRVSRGLAAGLLSLILILAVCLSFGCSENRSLWYIDEMNLNSAWESAEGAGVTIAFVDSGISTELYEANSDRIVAPCNVLQRNSDVTDENGHGTAMVSVACCDKESGIYGIAPEAAIMPIEATDEYGLVASEDENGVLCDFSSYSENKSIPIPGKGIEALSIDEDGNNVIKRSHGTSVSCAITAGIIALGLEINPDASVDLVTYCLNRASRGNIIDVLEFLSLISEQECVL